MAGFLEILLLVFVPFFVEVLNLDLAPSQKMASSVFKKLMPISRSPPPKDSGYPSDVSIEYSFALEYKGPPVDRSLPRAVPLDVDRIPTAHVAAEVLPSKLSFPVVQPIANSNPRESDLEPRRVSDSAASSTSSLRQGTGDMEEGGLDGPSCRGGGSRHERVDSKARVEIMSAVDGGTTTTRDNKGPALCSRSSIKSSPDGVDSSGSLGFSDSRDHSHELSGSSDMVETPFDCKEVEQGLQNYMNPANWNSTDPSTAATPQPFSAEVSCSEQEEPEVSDNDGCLQHRKNRTSVTFLEPESSHSVLMEEAAEGSSASEVNGIIRPEKRRVPEKVVKKGLCHRCLKGNILTDKEVCLACGAKYCCNCIVREMGSMPEGRKCLSCIGHPIDESKRKMLGKCSRLLKKLLSEDEVNQIMHAEVYCIANQLPPERVCVNGKTLDHEELFLLQTCQIPPKSLKPGNYWYDRVSGFWGKEGHKPCQIISPNLNVGEAIKRNASNGNTNVLINNREITAAELLLLRSAGVNCDGISSLWVYADGSYTEEGMNFEKGKIWGKKRTKVVATFLSLPTPGSPKADRDQMNQDAGRALPPYKFLLVGNDQSGTSTIFKQARVLYNVPFSAEERENIKCMIQCNLYGYLAILLEGRERFEEEHLMEMRRQSIDQPSTSAAGGGNEAESSTIYSISPRLKVFSEWLVKIMLSGNLGSIFPAATREYASNVEELWKDSAIQATYNRRNELELPRVANYFLDKAVEVAKVEYEPSDTDILYAEGISSSNGVASVDFTFPRTAHDAYLESSDQQDMASAQYQLIRVHTKSLGENCKWLEMFEDASIVVFCVSLTDYDEYEIDVNGNLHNKMLASKRLFERIITHPTLDNMNFLLILNKFDLLEEKIEHRPLNQCEWFDDFSPVMSRHSSSRSNVNNIPPLAQRAFHYVAVKFKRLFSSLTGRKLYVSRVTGLEQDTVGEALSYAREIIRWEEEKFTFSFNNEMSSESMEASSS